MTLEDSKTSEALAEIVRAHIDKRAGEFMPAPVELVVKEGSQQFETGYVWCTRGGTTTVRCMVPGNFNLTGATGGVEHIILALPRNADEPAGDYIAIGVVWNGVSASRIPPIVADSIEDSSGNDLTDHGSLSGLSDDDHSQYHTDARGDARYFTESEHLNSSAGAGDSGKPVKLDAGGHIDATMINDADVDHGTTGGLGDDDHTQYPLLAGRSGGQTLIGSTDSGEDLTLQSTAHATKGAIVLDDAIKLKASTILTLSTGAVTAVGPYHIMAAESGTTDDLDTITPSDDRTLLVIQADVGDTITVKDGTGNIQLNGGADFSLTGDATLLLFYDGTNWADLGAGGGGAGAISTTQQTIYTRVELHDETLGAAGSFDVSSISQDYEHLELALTNAKSDASLRDSLYIFFNNDKTVGNYRFVRHRAGSAHSAASGDNPQIATVPGSAAGAGRIGHAHIHIFAYTGSNNKQAVSFNSLRFTTSEEEIWEHAVEWENASAINRIAIVTNNDPTDEFIAGTRLQIWGWKAVSVVTSVSGGGATELTDLSDVNTAGVTKGNLLVADGTDYEAVAVGSNDQVLTADSAQSEGVKWADAAGGDGLLSWLGMFL